MADRTCSFADCSRPIRARGWCVTHYERWRQHGDVNVVLVQRNPEICVADDCDRKPLRRGYCNKHYQRWRAHGDPNAYFPNAKTRCEIEGCDRVHYARWFNTGDPVEVRPHFSPLAGKNGDLNPSWRGEEVGYNGVHIRLRSEHGPAKDYTCDHCGGEADDWAYTHEDPDERISSDGLAYSVAGRDFYIPLCRLCHRRFDVGRRSVRQG